MPNTIHDLWRMACLEKAPVVVMITKLREKNKVRNSEKLIRLIIVSCRVPVERKLSVCRICMKYRIILIIIIISLDEILLLYIANTSRMHKVNAPFRLFRWHSWPVAGSFN